MSHNLWLSTWGAKNGSWILDNMYIRQLKIYRKRRHRWSWTIVSCSKLAKLLKRKEKLQRHGFWCCVVSLTNKEMKTAHFSLCPMSYRAIHVHHRNFLWFRPTFWMRMVRFCKCFPRTSNTVLWRIFPLQRLDFGLEFWAYGRYYGTPAWVLLGCESEFLLFPF